MLFNINPVLPFQVADKLKHSNLSESTAKDLNESNEIASSSNGDLIDTVQKLEHQRQEIFDTAKQKIKIAQQHQGKGYNNCQTKGLPFEVSQKVLKLNFQALGKLNKLKLRYLGPYMVCSHSSAGNSYFLTDWYSHQLWKPVPTSQLVKFYDNKGSHIKKSSCIDSDCSEDQQSSSSNMEYSSPGDENSDCKRAKVYNHCDKQQSNDFHAYKITDCYNIIQRNGFFIR